MEEYFYYPEVMTQDYTCGMNEEQHAFILRTILRKKKGKTWYEIYIKGLFESHNPISWEDKYKTLKNFHRSVYETLILGEIHPKSKIFYPKSVRQDSEFDRLANKNHLYNIQMKFGISTNKREDATKV
jgi:hypothetical protein